MSKLKQIHNLLIDLTRILKEKEEAQAKTKLPKDSKEFTKGQLYEARYILDVVEKIIYEDNEYKF